MRSQGGFTAPARRCSQPWDQLSGPGEPAGAEVDDLLPSVLPFPFCEGLEVLRAARHPARSNSTHRGLILPLVL